jgi:hypothetical protein
MSKKFYPCDPDELAEYIIRAFTFGNVEAALEYMENRKERYSGPYRDSWDAAIEESYG